MTRVLIVAFLAAGCGAQITSGHGGPVGAGGDGGTTPTTGGDGGTVVPSGDLGPGASPTVDGGGGACANPLDLVGCACDKPGATRACYTGPKATENVGTCKDGTQQCVAQGEFSTWGPCTGDVLPTTEDCAGGKDTNCNGQTACDDIACAGMPGCCTPGQNRACYDGPPGTQHVGACSDGMEVCTQAGAWSMTCSGERLPSAEAGHCTDGVDNDCNGLVDCKDPACATDPACIPKVCTPGAKQSCYTGPAGTENVGVCRPGTQTCNQQGQWDATCAGEVLPSGEAGHCSDGLDNDCNGLVDCKDPACANQPECIPPACTAGQTMACYDGPAGTDGVGACHGGTESCSNGKWSGACAGEVLPSSEFGHCTDGIDNDCNGLTDCDDPLCFLDPACQPPVCQANATQACYDGPDGTEGVGICHAGTEQCAGDGSGWGACSGEVVPGDEGGNCADGLDNDCNGLTDCDDPACAGASNCCTPTAGIDSTIYATSDTTLYIIDPSDWSESAVGDYGVDDRMTDIGMTPDGSLYTVSGTAMYQVDPNTAQASKVVDLGGAWNNALTFLPDGTLLAADASGTLKHVDPSTGSVTDIGSYGAGYGSSGDLVAVADGTMYGVSATDSQGNDVSSNNILITVDTNTGAATEVGYIGFGNVFGLAYHGGMVLGFDYNGDVLQIDPQSGKGTRLATESHTHFFGGTTSPLVPAKGCP